MGSYKTDQHRLAHRGKEFHFVSYDGHAANPARDIEAAPPMWYLMAGGRRHEVMKVNESENEETRARRFRAWLETHAFGRAK